MEKTLEYGINIDKLICPKVTNLLSEKVDGITFQY